MKNLNNSRQISGGAWSEFVDILNASIRHATRERAVDESVIADLKTLLVECLCERDEFDQYLRNAYGENSVSSLNCPGLLDYDNVLRSEASAKPSDSDSSAQSIDHHAFQPFSSNIITLINLGLKSFGKDTWGWAQVQKHYFPSIPIDQLRATYVRSIHTGGAEELKSVKLEQWCPEDDFRLVSEMDKHGTSYIGLHSAYLALNERVPLDEIKARLRTLLEGQGGNWRKKRTRKAKSLPIGAEEKDTELPLSAIPDDGDDWAIDDSLLPLGNLKIIHD